MPVASAKGEGGPVKVTIVGDGIAVWTCASGMRATGFEPRVYEAPRKVEAVGVGISPLAHAVRELSELGLDGGLDSLAPPPHGLSQHDRTGEMVQEKPPGRAAECQWPQRSVCRGPLQMLLVAAVRKRLGPDSVRQGLLSRPAANAIVLATWNRRPAEFTARAEEHGGPARRAGPEDHGPLQEAEPGHDGQVNTDLGRAVPAIAADRERLHE
ncbi:hypothetical protein [Streptomyces sp. NBC_01244]|uniref:hypothetical protein n=1 Tax=Streptomyces sp. NBC_01244 TaxID=2903797 RepID=UPI002E12EA4A|nr:hypothetical protein OG247_01035 [Streptomyces sp. NBC_01244]